MDDASIIVAIAKAFSSHTIVSAVLVTIALVVWGIVKLAGNPNVMALIARVVAKKEGLGDDTTKAEK